MKITVRSSSNVQAADEQESYLVSELEDEDAFYKAITSDYVTNMLYDSLLDTQEEEVKSLKHFVNSVYCQFTRDSEFGDQGTPEVELNGYGEDLFSVEALDPYTGHMENIPEAESDGYFVAESLSEKWNRDYRPDLQVRVDAINDKVDRYLEQHEDDDDAVELLWIEDDSPIYDDVQALKSDYLDIVENLAYGANDDISSEFNNNLENTEYLVNLLDANEVKFTADGDLYF